MPKLKEFFVAVPKKHICTFFLALSVLGVCIAQEKGSVRKQEDTWMGTVRFDPADMLINLHNALPGMSVTWTPYVLPNLGIPTGISVHVGWGVLPGVQVSLLSGVKFIPIGSADRDKNGLFLDARAGLSFFFNEGARAAFVAKGNIGYQLITNRGFVFTQAVGAVYNGRTGFGFNLTLALGFAYR